MLYEIWDHETGNCIGAYPDQGAALADVRATVRTHGHPAVASLVLLTAPDDGDGERIAEGRTLVQLAEADAPPLPPSTGRVIAERTTRHIPPTGRYNRGIWQKSGRSSPMQQSGKPSSASPYRGVRRRRKKG